MKGISLTTDEIKKIIESKDGVLLSDESNNGIRRITIQCNKDKNVWTTTPSRVINQHTWCNTCYTNKRKITVAQLKSIAVLRGYEIIEYDNYLGHKSKIKIYCPKHDYSWGSTISNFKHSSGNKNCKLCSAGAADIKTVESFIKNKNGTLVKKQYNKHRPLLVQCNKHNNLWWTNWFMLNTKNEWCSKCGSESRLIPYDKILNAVIERGGKLLTENCAGTNTKILVQCDKNHSPWITTHSYITSGYWCPYCNNGRQLDLFNIIKELLPHDFIEYDQRPFDWLRDVGKLEIDMWIPSLKLAIEYDGEQHFMPVKFGGLNVSDEQAQQNLIDLQRRDQLKNDLIAAHPEEVKCLVRFKYDDPITVEFVSSKLKDFI